MNPTEALRHYFGFTAFRDGQEAVIEALLSGRDVLSVMPTGAGKSLCYQLPALMQEGIVLVVSPLISLMQDQVTALKAAGIAGAYINSSLSPAQQAEALRRAAAGWYKIVYAAPERLNTPDFLRFARSIHLSLIAVDEAHCISQWGIDFRPSYLQIAAFIDALPVRPPVAAFTATATARVREDIVTLLSLRQPLIRATGFDRPNLHFSVRKTRTQAEKDALLLSLLRAHAGESGIIYCATRKAVEEVRMLLTEEGILSARYHAGLTDEERRRNQNAFRDDRISVMVATNAFGMGIDKPDVRFVIHYQLPKDPESYYQEAGRAGRDGEAAECILLYSPRDVHTARYLIEHGDGCEEKDDAAMQHKRAQDLERLHQMCLYASGSKCLRRFLLNYFGEHAPMRCGNCSVCLAAPAVLPPPEPREQGLYGALRELRGRIAALRGIPPHTVFSDGALRLMAERLPATPEELSALDGVGERRCALYGDDFLTIIRVYAKNTGLH